MRVLALMLGILFALASPARAQHPRHHVVIHVDSPDAQVMTEALHNAANLIETLGKAANSVAIEIVANRPGTSMFIDSPSPVKDEVRRINATCPDVVMSARAISRAHTEDAMKKTLTVLPEARIIPSGAVRIMKLEE
jgi:intracellular sulfur oxidation DsrE/DsrF family protein